MAAPARDGGPEWAGLLTCLLFALAWLLPNHYSPWPAFHSDALSAAGLLALALATQTLGRSPVRWPAAGLLLLAVAVVPLLQHAAGRVYFLGDALIASLYVAGLALALQGGAELQSRGRSALAPLLTVLLLVALASVLIATLQWLRLNRYGIFIVDMDPEGRPYANFAQPNQFATFLVLGLAAAFALHAMRLLSTPALVLAAPFLAFGIAMSRSRAGALEVAGLVAVGLLLRRRAGLRPGVGALLALGAGFAALSAGWPALCEALLLPNVRDGTMGSSNGRLELWWQMLVAIGREPWWGWGWNQVSVAQAAVAADMPPFRLMVEHAHNLALDLLLWNGVPLGALLCALLLMWFVRHLRACRDGATAWMLAGVVAFTLHALVEFPHDYAYLLFPAGLLAGAVEAGTGAGRFVRVPRLAVAALPLAGIALLAGIVAEYLVVEENHQTMRFEAARIGATEVSTAVPPLVLLTQLRDFLYIARHEVAPGMPAADLDRLRRVANRYAYPPVLLRLALAEALNGQPQRAAQAMRRLCNLHVEERCTEGLDSWAVLAAGTYPQIRAVELPQRPGR